jgi:hypothetical protein
MRKHGRVDANQDAIVDALRKLGVSVAILSPLGNGIGDLLIGFDGKNYLWEIKDINQPPSKRKLTPDEAKFCREWNGQWDLIMDIEGALLALGIKEKK